MYPFIFTLIAVVILIWGGMALMRYADSYESHAPLDVLSAILGFLSVLAGVVITVMLAIMCWSWQASKHKANIINREYHTGYTQEEIFFASDVIDTIRELNRKRIEVNGNVLGYGDPPKEPAK